MAKITIDPVTRIEGHLAVEVEIENGVVKDAWSKGQMIRGIEALLRGKDPRDAAYVTDRVCGVCTASHRMASALTLDDAFKANVPDGGRLMRNLILGAMYLHDHPLHFYHLSALDYIDIMAVAKYEGKDSGLNAVKDKIVGLVNAKDTSPLTPRYEPDEFSVTEPELATTAVSHYIKCLDIQAKAKRMGAVLGGKIPHNPTVIVGGVTNLPTMQQIDQFSSLFNEVKTFIKDIYVPDVLLFGTGPLLPLAKLGVGASANNFLAYGGFKNSSKKDDVLFKSGYIIDGDLENVKKVDPKKIKEYVTHSWYKSGDGLHPSEGELEIDRDKKDGYSFLKAPRYEDKAMEVGPLARMLVSKNEALMDTVKKHDIKPGAVARHAARALETLEMVNAMELWLYELSVMVGKRTVKVHDTNSWRVPESGQGMGLTEAPRGALGHWINIQKGKIANYNLVVPSTWNLSPRDKKGTRGPVEQSLVGVPVSDVKNPNNIVRVIRSFDPCISCAVHIIEPYTNEILKFQIG